MENQKTPQEIKHDIIVGHLKEIIKCANICLERIEQILPSLKEFEG